MKVTEEEPAPTVDLAAAEQIFTELYREYWDRLRRFIWWRLDIEQGQLAEDLAQETFMELWRLHLLKGKESEGHIYGLLCTMARSQIGKHFRKVCSKEKALDFGDPVNTPMIVTGHAYAKDTPDLAPLVNDLDVAMERMAAASTLWREKNKEWSKCRSLLDEDVIANRGGLSQVARARLGDKLAKADDAEAEALSRFQQTCQRVGELRAEMEKAAGPNWQSSIGLPRQQGETPPPPTHCPQGHPFTRANTYYKRSKGYFHRSCRTCAAEWWRANNRTEAPNKMISAPNKMISEEAIQAARKMLLDPQNKQSIRAIAESVGTSLAVLYKRIPNLSAIRRAVRHGVSVEEALTARIPRTDATPVEVLDSIRKVLLDPEELRPLSQIAFEVGICVTTIRRNLKDEVAAHKARRLTTRSRIPQPVG